MRALAGALRVVLDRPDASFDDLVRAAPLGDQARASLLDRDIDALDALLVELNEVRDLVRTDDAGGRPTPLPER